jgi:crotonobetainyl-CoA:carnitine CoA-transferase CaiB-like acyl-CoA transferase
VSLNGFGATEALARNPRLVYGRVIGWGQSGPLAHEPGHDINYIALSGVLNLVGRPSTPPTPPLALVGDFAGHRGHDSPLRRWTRTLERHVISGW